MTIEPRFFRTPSEFRKWLKINHVTIQELWVGFHKKASGKPSITWPESVDEALCFGWIDGIRKRIDEVSYQIRFTPRRRGSIWSAINIRRAKELTKEKRMHPMGLKAFAARIENKSGIYSYEQRRAELEDPYKSQLKRNRSACDFFRAQPPSYRRMVSWYIMSAKTEETRSKRFEKLMKASAKRRRL